MVAFMTNDPAPARTRRAPAKKAASVQRRVIGKAEPEALTAAVTPTAEAADMITFQGRTMRVKMPNPEQIALWPRLADKINSRTGELDDTPRDGETADQARTRAGQAGSKLVGRMLTLIASVLPEQDDKDWLEDQIIGGDLRLASSDGSPAAADVVSKSARSLACACVMWLSACAASSVALNCARLRPSCSQAVTSTSTPSKVA